MKPNICFCGNCYKSIKDIDSSFLWGLFCSKDCYKKFDTKGNGINKCPKCRKFEAVKQIHHIHNNRTLREFYNYCNYCYGSEKDKIKEIENKTIRNTKKIALLEKIKQKTKCCIKCKIVKDKIEFSKNKNYKDGYVSTCKVCFKANKKAPLSEKEKFYKDLKKANKNLELEKRRFNVLNPYLANTK